ncbi:putative O-glycosylation ligase, exosortase A system-associated [Salinisphaera hydrothermalis]|uniref:Putative O-glycosylation ligase, exosortase system type 1-associated protein n=1 Tax=Salinisphaera hydrothermalis (strain C41B8) TaxID=1304275 RepID=A0A084IMD4_SALHC|nr:putative O-glycosylation ligase, exosortase A system-associated [Salinisphaera hydrothermalis]KEZ77868.1 putative O-glycosylation ligase, exosortase system type 1-associated protein [Salinisphaera hydrothermalis C41B8]
MRSLALLLFVAGTLPMAFVRPIIGLLLWMMFSYLNPHRLTWGFAVDFPWVFITAGATLVALLAHPGERQAPPMKPIVVLMTLFLGWITLSTFQATVPDAAFTRYEQFLKMMTMAYVTLMLVIDRQRLDWVIWTIVASFGFWGFKGGLFTLLTGGNYHVMGPESSFFTDNNIFALIMCMTLPLMRYVQLQVQHRWLRLGLWLLMGLTAVSIVGTYSRGGLLALAVTATMLIWKSRRRAMLILVAPVAALALASFMPPQYFHRMHTIDKYHQDASAQGRIESWKFATHVALAHPLVGGGMEVWSSHDMWRRYGPEGAVPGRAIHSIFFEVLGEQGFVGLGLFLASLLAGYLGLGRVRRRARAGPTEAWWLADLASMMQVSLIAYIAAGALLPMPYIDLLYQLFALIAVMQLLTEKVGVSEVLAQPESTPGRRPPRPRRPRTPKQRHGGDGVRNTQDLPHW